MLFVRCSRTIACDLAVWAAVLGSLGAVRTAWAGSGDAKATSGAVGAALDQHRQQVNSAYLVFDVSSENLVDMEILRAKHVADYLLDQTVTFAAYGGRCYLHEVDRSSMAGIIPDRMQVWKDGKLLERRPNLGAPSRHPETDIPQYLIEVPNPVSGARFPCLYFTAICFDYKDPTRPEVGPGTASDLNPWKLDPVARVLRDPQATVRAGSGPDEVILNVPGQQTLRLDASKGYALTRRELSERGEIKYVIEARDHYEALKGVWMPRTVEFSTIGTDDVPADLAGKPILKHMIRLKELHFNDPKYASLLDHKISPGALVIDLTTKPLGASGEVTRDGSLPSISYRQPVTESGLAAVVDEARRQIGYEIESEKALSFWLMIMATAATLLVSLTAILYYRSRNVAQRPGRSSNPSRAVVSKGRRP